MEIKLHIHVDDRLLAAPRWLRRHPLVLAGLFVLAGGATALAVVDPGDFQNGTPIDAGAVNTRFARLYAAVDDLETRVVDIGGAKYSLGAVYKFRTDSLDGSFATTSASGQPLTGYAAAKRLCEVALDSPSAHMCDAQEMVRTFQAGLVPEFVGVGTVVWISTGVASGQSPGPVVRECQGWTSAATTFTANAWGPDGPVIGNCDAARPIACCD